jgi:hypothetical protein
LREAPRRVRFQYILYLSLGFLIYALYRADYLKLPPALAPGALVQSCIYLFLGFILQGVAWRATLGAWGFHVPLAEALASLGLSSLAKYIPGRFWIIVGRAAYLSDSRRWSLGRLSLVSLTAQLILMWTGMVLGGIGLIWLDGFRSWSWGVSFVLLLLTLVVFSGRFHGYAERLALRILRRKVEIPSLPFVSTLSLLPWFFLVWATWTLAFSYLVASFPGLASSLRVGLGFPLASTLGIMAVFAPAGLGAREGLLAGYLVLAGLPLAQAATISIAARLLFLAGELFVFLVGLVADRRVRVLAGRREYDEKPVA